MKTNHISISQQKVNWKSETDRIIKWISDTDVMAVYIDLFCGFGGTTSGIEKAEYAGKKMGIVILGINHDDIALACHRAHNPDTLHLREDVRKVKSKPEEKEDFLIKYNSSSPNKGDYHHSIIGMDQPAPTIVGRNMIAKTHPEFLPFIVQFNNHCNFNSVDEPSKVLTKKDKFSLAFIQQRHNGNPSSKVYSTDRPARTVTSTGGNQDLVQVEQILPYISNYHGNGHNCQSVDEPCPVVPAADTGALIQPEPFIFRQFSNGGQSKSINDPAGSILQYPKMNIVSPSWIMDPSFKNVGRSIDEPAKTMLASRKHAYIVNPSYYGNSSSVDNPSPVVVARQDKAPLHLAQVQFGEEQYYGIVIYKTDSKEIKELKLFMAIYGIVDIKMRMLKEIELLPIQGFPPDYIEKVRAMGIKVTGTDAKKYIGNSQEVTTAKCLFESYGPIFFTLKEQYFKNAA